MSEFIETLDREASERRTYSQEHVDAIRARLNRAAEGFDRVSNLADEILEEME